MLLYYTVGILILLLIPICLILSSYEKRRICYVSWVRLTRYEFWPSSVFYLPALVYYVLLCLPYRSLGLLSIVNPGMLNTGMYQSPKLAVLHQLANNDWSNIARCHALPYQQKQKWLGIIQQFIDTENIGFPLVIKPQVGQRGTDINIVHHSSQLKATINRIAPPSDDYMVQEYAPGNEFGILYARLPQSSDGRIVSIVHKQPIYLKGNGKDNLKRLILAHPRACLLFRIHFKLHKQQLNEVLPSGETMRLTPLNTHSKGAIFRSANHLINQRVSAQIDKISKNYPGFYLGRYDVISPDQESLKRGEFKVIELNSVMGEPGDMYDPSHTLWHGYKLLFSYCRLAVRIAAANLAAGYQPLSWRAFLRTTRHAYRSLL